MTSAMDRSRQNSEYRSGADATAWVVRRFPRQPHAYRCAGCGTSVSLAGRDCLPEGWRVKRRRPDAASGRNFGFPWRGADFYCPECGEAPHD